MSSLNSTFKVEVEDDSLVWQDVTYSVESLVSGTTSESQLIPTVAILFGLDVDEVAEYLDPKLNPERARIRVTLNTTTTYYLMENQSGIVDCYDYPTVGGRAFCGRVVDFPLGNYINTSEMPMSALAQQLCTENLSDQTGQSIAVDWQATQNPTIPLARIEFTRVQRLTAVRDLAWSCGADVRASQDGLSLEGFNIPRKTLDGSVVLAFDDVLTLGYTEQRINKPLNAVRIKGEVFGYSDTKNQPSILVFCSPDSILADGVSTTSGTAQVFRADGEPVSHSEIIDEPITGTSNTEIPVTTCWKVSTVWLNDGSQSVPVQGQAIQYTDFDASTITVADNGTDLFIVSYTQATEVSWSVDNYAENIDSEPQNTTGALEVETDETIGNVIGVWRASDSRRVGTNFYTDGSFTGTTITLGISPDESGDPVAVLIDYVLFNATPLTGLSVSPSTSLTDEDGMAQTLVSSGTEIGVGQLQASATVEGQPVQNFAQLSLTGAAIGSLELTANPGIIRTTITGEQQTTLYTEEISSAVIDTSGNVPEYYALADNAISYVAALDVTQTGTFVAANHTNVGSTYKAFIGGSTENLIGGELVLITYYGYVDVSEAAQVSTITATALKEDGTTATDGTVVSFAFASRHTLSCTLSAASATTTDGVASVTLQSGDQAGTVLLQAAVGGFRAEVPVQITSTGQAQESSVNNIYLEQGEDGLIASSNGTSGGWPTNNTGGGWPTGGGGGQVVNPGGNVQIDNNGDYVIIGSDGSITYVFPDGSPTPNNTPYSQLGGPNVVDPNGVPGEICRIYPNDSVTDVLGFVSGSRRLIGCEGEPLINKAVVLPNGIQTYTDGAGIFTFTQFAPGSNTVIIDGRDYGVTISPDGSDDRGGYNRICRAPDGTITSSTPYVLPAAP